LYGFGICTSCLREHRAGLPYEHPVEDAVLQVEVGVFAVVGVLQVAMRPTTLIGWVMTTVALVVAIFKAGNTYIASTTRIPTPLTL
jgi:hypothetical protein